MNLHTSYKFDRVMIVDDNNIDLYVASRVIEKSGFAKNVLRYTSAREALQFLNENSNDPALLPEIIFVDIYMPDMSGFEFMTAYNNLPPQLKKHSNTYIISSSLDENDINRANDDINIKSFHEKPVNKALLQKIIDELKKNI